MSALVDHMIKPMMSAKTPLCVDLDGTLTYTDFLIESILGLVKTHPLTLFYLFIWVFKGKAYFKDQIASRIIPNVEVIPYHLEFLKYLEQEHQSEREIYLCTASNYRIAQHVSAHFGFFAGVIASDATHNLAGKAKAQALVDRFGAHGFDYCGNSLTDVPVWRVSREAIVVGGKKVIAAAKSVSSVRHEFLNQRSLLKLIIEEMRVYQWVKNALIFVPLLAAHRFSDGAALMDEAIAFSSFSLCASSVYLLNDLLDLEADRKHPRKRRRPLASGRLPLSLGIALTFVLLVVGLQLAISHQSPQFVTVLLMYLITTTAYSFWLKRIVLIDVFTLAALYTSRILAGGAVEHIHLSYWLILFSVLIFLSLAMVKRYAELDKTLRARKEEAEGRGYHVNDLSIIQSLGTAAGYGAMLVLALYMNTPEVLVHYHHQRYLWALFCLLLYWISNMWFVAVRGGMHDDPIVYSAKNKASLAVIGLSVLTVLIAS